LSSPHEDIPPDAGAHDEASPASIDSDRKSYLPDTHDTPRTQTAAKAGPLQSSLVMQPARVSTRVEANSWAVWVGRFACTLFGHAAQEHPDGWIECDRCTRPLGRSFASAAARNAPNNSSLYFDSPCDGAA
jgi:hypothetical protein